MAEATTHTQHILLKSWNLSLRRDLVDHKFIQHLLNSSPTVVRYGIYHAIFPSHIQYFNPSIASHSNLVIHSNDFMDGEWVSSY